MDEWKCRHVKTALFHCEGKFLFSITKSGEKQGFNQKQQPNVKIVKKGKAEIE
jgi:hypothetical protein